MKPGDEMVPKNFDPDLSPDAEVNKDAAKARRVRYIQEKKAYVDEDGCMIYDRYGQPL